MNDHCSAVSLALHARSVTVEYTAGNASKQSPAPTFFSVPADANSHCCDASSFPTCAGSVSVHAPSEAVYVLALPPRAAVGPARRANGFSGVPLGTTGCTSSSELKAARALKRAP